MLNLKGQAEKGTVSENHGLGSDRHQNRLVSSFASVLAEQVSQGQAEKLAALSKKAVDDDEDDGVDNDKNLGESSDIDFDDMDTELDKIQATRRAEISKVNEELAEWKAKGHGIYDITIQSEFLPIVTTTQYCIVHFFHKAFERCKIIGKHLNLLAPQYYPVRFLSIDAEKTPFFVEKLQITVLPTVILFKDGKVVDRLTGFSDLGNRDDFTTAQLETRLKQSGIMKKLPCHYTCAERLEEDEKRNKKGQGTLFRSGLDHGPTIDE